MAKQLSGFIEGTIDDICFYRCEGNFYARMKSSLTGKRFWRDEAFSGSRKSCGRFGEGNRIASKVYRIISREKRVYALFCFLKKRAILMLKVGSSVEETEVLLLGYLMDFGLIEPAKKEIITAESDAIKPVLTVNKKSIPTGRMRIKRHMNFRIMTRRSEVFVFKDKGRSVGVAHNISVRVIDSVFPK
jgi:hypothetical protein